MSWADDAECLHHDPEYWWPVGRVDNQKRRAAVAKAAAICNTKCPVRAKCAEHALKTGKTIGIWAGVDLGDNASRLHRTEKEEAALRAVARGVTAA